MNILRLLLYPVLLWHHRRAISRMPVNPAPKEFRPGVIGQQSQPHGTRDRLYGLTWRDLRPCGPGHTYDRPTGSANWPL